MLRCSVILILIFHLVTGVIDVILPDYAPISNSALANGIKFMNAWAGATGTPAHIAKILVDVDKNNSQLKAGKTKGEFRQMTKHWGQIRRQGKFISGMETSDWVNPAIPNSKRKSYKTTSGVLGGKVFVCLMLPLKVLCKTVLGAISPLILVVLFLLVLGMIGSSKRSYFAGLQRAQFTHSTRL